MSEPTTVRWNTQEQVLSTDLNRMGALAGKSVQDMLIALLGGIDASSTPRNVVRRGLDASPGAGLSVSISAGDMMRFQAGPSANLSEYRLGSLAAATTVPLNAADGVNPRIDRISVLETQTDTDSTTRLVISLPSRVVTPTPVPKTRIATLTLVATAGTPAATPVAPATPGGRVAIWDVLVPAAATTIDNAHLMDLRFRMHASALAGKHFVERGMSLGLALASLTTVRVISGRAFVDGAEANNFTDKEFPATGASSIIAPGESALAADQEWHCYVIAKGMGVPVGKTITDGLIFVLSAGVPLAGGFPPGGGVTFNPLYGISGAPSGMSALTQRALYIGTIHTDGSGNFEFGGGGASLNRDGSSWNSAVDSSVGRVGGWSVGFIKKPRLSWVDVSTVRVGASQLVLGGATLNYGGGNAGWADIHSGDTPDSAGVFYYVYLRLRVTQTGRRGALRSVRPIISTEAPSEYGHKPTPAAGFGSSEYIFVGSFFNDAGSNIRRFWREGSLVLWGDDVGIGITIPADLTQDPTYTPVTAVVPATSRIGRFKFTANLLNAGGLSSSALLVRAEVGSGENMMQFDLRTGSTGGGASAMTSNYVLDIPVDASDQFEVARGILSGGTTPSFEFSGSQVGYYEDVGAHQF